MVNECIVKKKRTGARNKGLNIGNRNERKKKDRREVLVFLRKDMIGVKRKKGRK